MIVSNLQNQTWPNKPQIAHWEIRLDERDFISWKSSLNEPCLFFDGASKGNPGSAGCGGVNTLANGNVLSNYSWGLGIDSNNIAEFCGLLQGLRIALSKGFAKLSVFGDSRLLIHALIRKKHPSQLKLAQIYQKIRLLSKNFQTIRFFHVLHGLNSLADKEANRGSLLGRGILIKDGFEHRCNVP